MTQAELVVAFNDEVGDASSIFTASEVARWFNVGQSRLEYFRFVNVGLAWIAGDVSVNLPADFANVERFLLAPGVVDQGWMAEGDKLWKANYAGATAAGNMTMWYWAFWPAISAISSSFCPAICDAACVYYALHRAYRKLASNRSLFKRYSVLLGANAVSVAEIEAASQAYYEDFLLTKEDFPLRAPAGFYED